MNDSEPAILGGISVEEIEASLERLLNSHALGKSPALRQLLEHLVRKAASGQIHDIKEHVIGIDVFGRSEDFDSRTDNIVRVQAYRLRKILACYYEDEGKADTVEISIPKGSYVPKIDRRASVERQLEAEQRVEPCSIVHSEYLPAVPSSEEARSARFRRPFENLSSLSKLGILSAFAAGAFCVFLTDHGFVPRMASAHSEHSSRMLTRSVLALWKPILEGQAPTVASFVNPVFVRAQGPNSGIFPYSGPIDVPLGTQVDFRGNLNERGETSQGQTPMFLNDTWTGTGEVLAINKLTLLFAEAGRALNVKRSRMLSAQDMQGMNVIFVGYSSHDPILKKVMSVVTPFSCCQGTAIASHEFRGGHPIQYGLIRDQSSNQLIASHALFSVLPGSNPKTKILVSAGLSTHGTWAAIDYMTSEAGAAALIRRLRLSETSLPEYFQAIVRTEIVNGEAANASLVAARRVCLSARAECSSVSADSNLVTQERH